MVRPPHGLSRLYAFLLPHRHQLAAVSDACTWILALTLATWMRYEFQAAKVHWDGLGKIVPFAVGLQLLLGWLEGLYRGRFSFGSFEEVAALVRCVVATGLALTILDAVTRWVPISVPAIGGFVAIVVMGGARYGWRLWLERRRRPDEAGASRTIVFGAGEGGSQVITAMLRNPESRFLPVAIVDDDARKQNLRVRNVPVRGRRDDLARIAQDSEAETMLIAIPSADAALVRELSEIGVQAGLKVRVLPPVTELLDGRVGDDDIRALTEEDLLGRREIDTDLAAAAGYLEGRRVLITGAGGSIGAELCRQVHAFRPATLVMLDRDESALHGVQLSIEGRALLDSRDLVVADIRDRERLEAVFAEHQPEVVFHAAALKHLPLLQLHPTEGLKTNVRGTENLLEVSLASGVARFVNVSTDKAADPESVLGYTKRITERLTAAADERSDGDYLSVRFGNVLGSRGSVLTTFDAQIEAGGPVTVTHSDATRYFMTIEEAVQLVIQAGALGSGGDVLVLDMGEPVRIADLARRLVERADRSIEIVFTGLRAGEKVHEQLIGRSEVDHATSHPLISRVPAPALDPSALVALDPSLGETALVYEMRMLAWNTDPTLTWSPPRTADD